MGYKLRQRFQSSSTLYTDKDCQLSNDPPGDGEVQELSLCNIQQYRCQSEEEDAEELLIAYQYEMFLNEDLLDQDLARQYLEEAMLAQLASHTGTSECDETDRGIFSNILGVNRAPDDTFDFRFDGCISPPMEGTVCVSMLGGSTVFLRSRNRRLNIDDDLQAAVVEFIRSEMENDVYVRSGSIEKIVFVNRTVAVNDVLDGDMSTKPRASGLATGAKAGIATGASLFFLFFLLLICLAAKGNRRQARVLEDPDEDEYTNGEGSLAKKDSLALKPREASIAQTPPRKILSKDAVQTTPETPESDISFYESPNEKQSSASPASIMARADSTRRSDSFLMFAASKSEAAEESNVPQQGVATSSSDVVETPTNGISRAGSASLAPAFSQDSDTVSDVDQGCCMGFSLV